MRRRTLLRYASVGALVPLGGCAALDSEPPETIISDVYANNHHVEPHTIHLLIFDIESDEPREPVYFQSRDFEANDPSETYESSGWLFEGLPTTPGTYHIEVCLDQREWDSVSVDAYENVPDEIVVGITIGYMLEDSESPAWKVTVREAKTDETTTEE